MRASGVLNSVGAYILSLTAVTAFQFIETLVVLPAGSQAVTCNLAIGINISGDR